MKRRGLAIVLHEGLFWGAGGEVGKGTCGGNLGQSSAYMEGQLGGTRTRETIRKVAYFRKPRAGSASWIDRSASRKGICGDCGVLKIEPR